MTNITNYPLKPGLLQKILSSPDPEVTTRFVGWIIERDRVYRNRVFDRLAPWTDDPIIAKNRFCNAWRCADTVSQQAIRIANSGDSLDSFRHQFCRSLTFRFFNSWQTWEHLCNELGEEPNANSFDRSLYTRTIDEYREAGEVSYYTPYISPPPIGPEGVRYVDRHGRRDHGMVSTHAMHFDLLDRWLNVDDIPSRILECGRLEEACRLFQKYTLVGPFLALQWSIDLGYGPWLPVDWQSQYVVPGPGAVRGLKRMFPALAGVGQEAITRSGLGAQIIGWLTENHPLNLTWFGRPLQLIDVQNCLCEPDKYCRVITPGNSAGSKKIKRTYSVPDGTRRPLPKPIAPPHWEVVIPPR
jgi:hypothetical protein